MSNAGRFLVALPTFNEKDNIEPLVRRLLATSQLADVLVIDDGSPDGTGDAVRRIASRQPRVRLHERPEKLGLGSAYVVAFDRALAEGYRAVCTMDADHSHDPAHLPAMLAKLEDADLVIGSRYCRGGRVERWSLGRKINSAVANGLARLVLGADIKDTTSGYRVYSSRLLRAMKLTELRAKGYSLLVELLYHAVRSGARIVEVPIVFHNRLAGVSKISVREVLGSLATLWRLERLALRM